MATYKLKKGKLMTSDNVFYMEGLKYSDEHIPKDLLHKFYMVEDDKPPVEDTVVEDDKEVDETEEELTHEEIAEGTNSRSKRRKKRS